MPTLGVQKFLREQEQQLEREAAAARPIQPNARLNSVIEQDFRPEFDRLQSEQPGLEQRFLDAQAAPIDFEAFRGELSELAESVTSDLFGAGGAVETAQRGARGEAVQSGFGTSSGGLTNATQNIFAGARDEVANVVGQQAVNIAGFAVQDRATTLGALGGFTQFQGSRLDSLRESLFGGQASIEQLRLAEEQLKDNRRILDESLKGKSAGDRIGGAFSGAATGALIGSAIPGVGTAIGAGIGFLGGLF